VSRPAPYANPLSYADEALAAKRGLIVNVGSRRIARNLRMNFYAKRAEAREAGIDKYDNITCFVEDVNVVFRKKVVTEVEVRAL
jgi:hypothetical protein